MINYCGGPVSTLLTTLATPKVIGAAVAGVVAVGGVVAVAAADDGIQATVVDVVDGDTIDVRYDGGLHRVRLLNVDTPEPVDPEQPVQCLGPEASEYLEELLPRGTSVRLEYDVEKRDGYGRELAGVFLGDSLVNADIARQGLGVAIAIGENLRFLQAVQAGQAEAQRLGRGLYADEVACTLPAQVTAAEAAASAVQPMAATAAPTDIAAAVALMADALLQFRALLGVLDGDPRVFPLLPFGPGELADLRSRVATAHGELTAVRDTSSAALEQARARVEAEQRAADEARRAAEEAARLAAEEAARRAAEEAAAQQRSPSPPRPSPSTPGNGGSRSDTPAPAPAPAPSPAPAPAPPPAPAPAPTGGSDGYTGCRAYGPNGTSVDDQGRRYTKIDCTTRQPIG
jgi:micrococcal nuclease